MNTDSISTVVHIMSSIDINSQERQVTEEEEDYAFAALEEWQRTGKTSRCCPWCGGDFEFRLVGNSGVIRCNQDRCFEIGWRGL